MIILMQNGSSNNAAVPEIFIDSADGNVAGNAIGPGADYIACCDAGRSSGDELTKAEETECYVELMANIR